MTEQLPKIRPHASKQAFEVATLAIAMKFSALLLKEIGWQNFRDTIRINRTRTDRTCASHDFCDANLVMLDAFMDVVGTFAVDSAEDADLWNAAWDAAIKWEMPTTFDEYKKAVSRLA